MKIQHRKRLTAWIGAVCMLFSFAATAFAATTISDSDNSGADTFTTSGGKVMIAPIKPGTYTITEVQAAPGYASAADVNVTVTNANRQLYAARTALRWLRRAAA